MVTQTTSIIWLERNQVVFRRNRNTTLTSLLWRLAAAAQLEALEFRADSAKIRRRIKGDYELIQSFLDTSITLGDQSC